MPVFKAYFKVMRSSVVVLLVNLAVFMGLVVLFSVIAPDAAPQSFEPTRTPLAVINRDGDAALARGLAEYLLEAGLAEPLPDDLEKMQDALFFRQVEYIAIIPAGFSESFMARESPVIEKAVVPDSTSSYYVDLSLDRFLNTASYYRDFSPKKSEEELVLVVRADLAVKTPVTFKTAGNAQGYLTGYHYYFSYCGYALLAIVITGISSIMLAFNRSDLCLRNQAAPLSRRQFNLQLAAGHSTFALGCWVLLMAGSLLLHGKSLFSTGLTGLYFLNTLVFTVVCAAIGFAAGIFIQNQAAQAGVITATSLGLSFLGGVFVPQMVMSKPVLAVAKFLPSYWYIKANDAIGLLGAPAAENLAPIYQAVFIQLGFAVAIFSAGLLFVREKTAKAL